MPHNRSPSDKWQQALVRNPKRKILFWCITLALPLLILAIIEVGLRWTLFHPTSTDPFINIGPAPRFFAISTMEGEDFYRIEPEQHRYIREVSFPRHKDKAALRIFCLGGSASAGWPHPVRETYSAYLEAALKRHFPDREIQVLNVSAHAHAAYRVRMIFENVIEFDPDLLVIYSGNNEFLEERAYSRKAPDTPKTLDWKPRLAIYQVVSYSLKRALDPDGSLLGHWRVYKPHNAWSKGLRKTVALRAVPHEYESLKRHYAYSIEAMLEKAARSGVPVILTTVPANLRDWAPNASMSTVSGESRRRWARHMRDAERGLLMGRPAAGLAAIEQAIRLDPNYAEAFYLKGKLSDRAAMFPQASASYDKARDLDGNPFRATSEMNAILRELAAAYDHVTLVDLDALFRATAAPFAPGFDLFLDYVHPNKRGNLLIAEAVFDAVTTMRGLGQGSGEQAFTYVPEPWMEGGKIYREAEDLSVRRPLMRLFLMMHQYQSLVAGAKELEKRESADNRFGKQFAERVLEVFPKYLNARRAELMGENLSADDKAEIGRDLHEFYSHYFYRHMDPGSDEISWRGSEYMEAGFWGAR